MLRTDDAIAILDALGCANDPVKFGGVVTTVDMINCECKINSPDNARKFRITFAVSGGGWRYGTLYSMVLDRMK